MTAIREIPRDEVRDAIVRVLARSGGFMTTNEIATALDDNVLFTDLQVVRGILRALVNQRRVQLADGKQRKYRMIEYVERPRYNSGIEFSMAQILGEYIPEPTHKVHFKVKS